MPGTQVSPTTADLALIRAARAWGGPGAGDPWRRFSASWGDRLRSASAGLPRPTPEAARRALARDHEASARPDPARVHPSWYARALLPEAPAVRSAVARHSPGPIREALAAEPGLADASKVAGPPPDPEAIGWALAIWSERLVGDVPDRPDDPPVVVALTRLGQRDLARLARACGQAKHAFAIEGHGPTDLDEARVRMTATDRVRVGFFRRLIGSADPRLVPAARLDLNVIGDDRRRGHARLGLLTFGRLLGAAEPHRARWAMQHLPYPIVKRMREKGDHPLPPRALAAWESWVLEAAWARLLSEGRLDGRPGAAS